MTGYVAATCTCGHKVGDHKSNSTGWPHPLRYGFCQVPGCGCKEFSSTQEQAA